MKEARDEDLIIISDLDEIPNLDKLKEFNLRNRFAVFKQKHFYYKLNLQSQRIHFGMEAEYV